MNDKAETVHNGTDDDRELADQYVSRKPISEALCALDVGATKVKQLQAPGPVYALIVRGEKFGGDHEDDEVTILLRVRDAAHVVSALGHTISRGGDAIPFAMAIGATSEWIRDQEPFVQEGDLIDPDDIARVVAGMVPAQPNGDRGDTAQPNEDEGKLS